MSVATVVVAAGRGSRIGGEIPKQYRALAGKPVLVHALEKLLAAPLVDCVLPVIHPDDRPRFEDAVPRPQAAAGKLLPPVSGGGTRQESVRRGLEALADRAPDLVLIHDAARPFASAALFERAIAAGRAHGAAVPGVAPTDTIKVVNDREEVVDTPDRARLRAVQTPQSFRFAALLDAHRRAAEEGHVGFPDDGALAEWAGLRVTVFEGEATNVKLTLETDFASAERRLGGSGGNWIMRVGSGFDVHAFTAGDHVWLGGKNIPISPSASAPSTASVRACSTTSPSEWAMTPLSAGIRTPPSQTWSPAVKA